ncbi:MAG TPA: transcriptional regulator [Marmoricola sp.]|nr:transcriptional regulator [Marmoricola sp.]
MSRLAPVIHPPARLQICALLAQIDSAEFAFVREHLDVSDSVLSKHARSLQEAGYLKITKKTITARQRTWLSLTVAGRQAFKAHVAELHRLVEASSTQTTQTSSL